MWFTESLKTLLKPAAATVAAVGVIFAEIGFEAARVATSDRWDMLLGAAIGFLFVQVGRAIANGSN